MSTTYILSIVTAGAVSFLMGYAFYSLLLKYRERSKMKAKYLREYKKYDEFFVLEGIKLDIATEIKKLMDKNKISKRELANRLNNNMSYVTSILSGNISDFKELAKVISALEADVRIRVLDFHKTLF